MKPAALIAWGCAAAGVVGCAQATKPLDEAGVVGSPLQLLEKPPPSGALTAADFRLEAGDVVFLEVDDQGQAVEPLTFRREKTDQFGASMSLSEGSSRTQFLKKDEQGNIVMTAAVDHDEHAVSLFEPPMVVVYAELGAGESRTSESAMRVVDSNDHSKQREVGKARRTTTYAADQRIRTPAGEFTAKRVEVQFTADLGLADATEQSITFVVPQRGIVAERTIEERKILGAFGTKTRRTIVLAESPR
ncbi:MAG: hypothetical protein L0Y42_13495 [Phycisphaerales bacterium]|nr:hypothetical protein [Phycisphaerales bacterium]